MGSLRLLAGVLLVAGTTIGAAMLALPVTTAVAGFWPSLVLFAVIWAFMTYSAFLLLETNLSMEGRVNLITMARRTLGPVGEVIAWVSYLLLLYALTAAYLSASGRLLLEAVSQLFGWQWPQWVAPLPFALAFGLVIYLGIRSADRLNRLLMLGLALMYCLLVLVVSPQVRMDLLQRAFPAYALVPVAIVVTAFGFHIIIPSLVEYLERDLAKLRRVLIIGSCLPVVVYAIWEWLILGSLPLGELTRMLESGQPAAELTRALQQLTGNPVVATAVGLFSFFAIVTSFLGVSLSLSDFLRDGLRLEASRFGRLSTVILTFVPPLAFAWLYPKGFILALSYGGFFVALLLGLLPISMVFADRYVHGRKHPYRVWGGPVTLSIAFLFFVLVIVLEFTDTYIARELTGG